MESACWMRFIYIYPNWILFRLDFVWMWTRNPKKKHFWRKKLSLIFIFIRHRHFSFNKSRRINKTYWCNIFRSLPKLSSQDEEGGAGIGFPQQPQHFEPIPHDHDFCERVVINVRIFSPIFFSARDLNLDRNLRNDEEYQAKLF